MILQQRSNSLPPLLYAKGKIYCIHTLYVQFTYHIIFYMHLCHVWLFYVTLMCVGPGARGILKISRDNLQR
jgi:hypothetical protein